MIGPSGAIYVAQPEDNAIRLFDSTGRFARSIGRKGRGPGETQQLSGAGFVGDTLWISDGVERFSLFSPTGDLYSSFSATDIAVGSGMYAAPVQLAVGGLAYYFPQGEPGPEKSPGPAVLGTRTGTLLFPIAQMSPGWRGVFAVRSEAGGGRFGDGKLAQLLSTSPFVAINPTGEWFAVADQSQCANSASYNVLRISARGDTLARSSVACSRLTVGKHFLDSAVAVNRAKVLKYWKGFDPDLAEDQIRRQLGTPHYFANLLGLQVGQDGGIWMRQTTFESGPQEWTRLDDRRGLVDRVVLPPKSELMLAVNANVFWIVVLDDNDVPSVVRFRATR
jgi:hypothetical protein